MNNNTLCKSQNLKKLKLVIKSYFIKNSLKSDSIGNLKLCNVINKNVLVYNNLIYYKDNSLRHESFRIILLSETLYNNFNNNFSIQFWISGFMLHHE